MKNLKIVLFILLFSNIVVAQNVETVNLPAFTKIKISSVASVYLKQDSIQSVKIIGNQMNQNLVSVKDGVLNIDNSAGSTFYISIPKIEAINVDGKGDVTSESKITGDKLMLAIRGIGNIKMDIDVTTVEATVPGAGKIQLWGNAENANFNISGSGKVDAADLKLKNADVSISGIGKCMLDVKDVLNTNISGSGKVEYKSEPLKITNNISGIGKVRNMSLPEDSTAKDTTRIALGKSQLWFIGKKKSEAEKHKNTKPIWAGLELGLNSYMDNNGQFTLSQGKEAFDLKQEKSVSFALNFFQQNVQLGKSNIWLFTGLGVTWNNYRFANDVMLTKGNFTSAYHNLTPGVNHLKSKLVASYLMAPVMFEFFTSKDYKNAFHFGAGGMFGVLVGSHTKYKVEVDGNTAKLKDFDDYNLNPFRYGVRATIGWGHFNLFADYYASTLFKDKKGPTLFPVNAGITIVGF